MQNLLEDIQYALRNFLKTPRVCALIVITLALGIGANAAIFSMVYNVLLGPLPFSEGEQLFKLKTHNPKIDRFDVPVSVPTAFDYIEDNQTLSHVVEYHQMAFTLLGHGEPANVEAGVVSWDFFEMLKVRPILGRTFIPGEDEPGAKPLIVLSHHFWREKFGSDPDIVGRNLEMNNAVHQVIGVLPALPAYPFKNDIWIGSSSCPGRGSDSFISNRGRSISYLYGKLKPGVTLQNATLDINTISQRLEAEYPDIYREEVGLENVLTPLRADMTGNAGPTFYLLLGFTALVLLIACANVANLNLARMAARKQELAIREALGANPSRIARQVLTESILLSLFGGLVGLAIAWLSVDLLSSFAALYTPLSTEVEINTSVLLFCLVVSVFTGGLSGATAAFQKRNINEALKEGSGNITLSTASKRLRQGLLVVQFSLAFIILTSASLISLSLYRLSVQDIGFDSKDIIAVDLSTSSSDRRQFVREATLALEASPEIDNVAVSSVLPLGNGRRVRSFFQIEGRPPMHENERHELEEIGVSANYHDVLGIPLLEGRYLKASDDENNPDSILINQKFAKEFFAGQSPVGKRISLDKGESWLTIRGVVGDVRELGIDEPPIPTIYSPYIETWWYELRFLISSDVPMASLTPTINEAIHQANPRQSVADVSTLRIIKEVWLSSSRLVGMLVSGFALLAFLITLSGVVGVVAYNVSQQHKEIGIRVALGANPNRIRWLFAAQGMSLAVIGLLAGALIMALVAPLIEGVLYQTNPLNPAIYIGTAVIVAAVAMMAILLPTQQATAIQPNQALREQ